MRLNFLFIAFLFAGCASGLAQAEGPPPANVGPPMANVSTPPVAKVDCECSKGGPCTCDETCTCPGCKKHSNASPMALWATAAAIGCKGGSSASASAMDAVSYTSYQAPGTQTIMQQQCYTDQFGFKHCSVVPVTVASQAPVQVAAAEPVNYSSGDKCPCCGMIMTESQAKAASKVKATITAPPTSFVAPSSYYAAPMMAGDCASCAGVGAFAAGDGSSIMAGSGRPGLFPRWKARRAARAAGGGCGG